MDPTMQKLKNTELRTEAEEKALNELLNGLLKYIKSIKFEDILKAREIYSDRTLSPSQVFEIDTIEEALQDFKTRIDDDLQSLALMIVFLYLKKVPFAPLLKIFSDRSDLSRGFYAGAWLRYYKTLEDIDVNTPREFVMFQDSIVERDFGRKSLINLRTDLYMEHPAAFACQIFAHHYKDLQNIISKADL